MGNAVSGHYFAQYLHIDAPEVVQADRKHLNSFSTYNSTNIINQYVILAPYCSGDKIEKNETGWACDADG